MAFTDFFDTRTDNPYGLFLDIEQLDGDDWYDVAVYDAGNYKSTSDAFDAGALYTVDNDLYSIEELLTCAGGIQAAAECTGAHLIVAYQIGSSEE
jgi:hypothetical protein